MYRILGNDIGTVQAQLVETWMTTPSCLGIANLLQVAGSIHVVFCKRNVFLVRKRWLLAPAGTFSVPRQPAGGESETFT
jgi:hypothetical protein